MFVCGSWTNVSTLGQHRAGRPSWLPRSAADLESIRAGRPRGVQSISETQPRALRCKEDQVKCGQQRPPWLLSAQTMKERRPGWSDVKWRRPQHIQAILLARISGCTISERQHVRFRATHRNRRQRGLMTCAHENRPRFEAERAFHNCPVSGHRARRDNFGHRETVISRAPLTV